MTHFWIGVASREHVLNGVREGIAQVCHGKGTPLKQMKGGDWIVYYSPSEIFGGSEPCRCFTAIGRIADEAPYQYQMAENFIPWRRKVNFIVSREAAIEPMIDKLSFIEDKKRWGFPFRRGCFKIIQEDFVLIANEMRVDLNEYASRFHKNQ